MIAEKRVDHAFRKNLQANLRCIKKILTDCNNTDNSGHKFMKLFKILVQFQFVTSKVVLDI